ncbi:MAG: ATP-binding protein [Verrucomicrobia bacterium]|nr:ATP-binding protein [Verrucomicrobiota bacterium]
MPSGRILAAHVAGDGQLWCGTTAGACVFDGELWSVLDTRDGLSGNEVFSIRSDADGTLWFGTDQGLTRYVPVRGPTRIHIASVASGSEPTRATDGRTVNAGEPVTILAETDRANRVRWRVRGAGDPEGAWSLPAPSPSLTWRPEHPGDFVIEAMAVDRDLNRSPTARVELHARRPWYRNPWLLGAGGAGGVGVLAMMFWMMLRSRSMRMEAVRLRRQAAENAAQERLREEFARELIHSQEAERRRLAGELHDSLGQELLLIRNTALLAAQSGTAHGSIGPLADIADRASRTIEEVRSIAYALRPQELDRLGLVRALRTLCEEMTEAAALQLRFDADPVEGTLSPDAEISLYRAVQEALSNVVRHADARQVQVHLRTDGGGMTVELRDDGVGFVPNPCAGDRAGLGLMGMNERLRLVGGSCSIRSSAGAGTVVEFRIPLGRPRALPKTAERLR